MKIFFLIAPLALQLCFWCVLLSFGILFPLRDVFLSYVFKRISIMLNMALVAMFHSDSWLHFNCAFPFFLDQISISSSLSFVFSKNSFSLNDQVVSYISFLWLNIHLKIIIFLLLSLGLFCFSLSSLYKMHLNLNSCFTLFQDLSN